LKLRSNLTLVLAVIALALALLRGFRAFGTGSFGTGPVALVVVLILVLLGARYAMERQKKLKRDEILKAVPKRPLGLSDHGPDEEGENR